MDTMEFARLSVPAGVAKVSGLVGVVTASVGAVFGVITAESASGIMVAAGGFGVVIYGLVAAGKEKRTRSWIDRAVKAEAELDETIEKLWAARRENAMFRGKLGLPPARDEPQEKPDVH